MAKLIVIIFVSYVCAYSTEINAQGTVLSRIARSPFYGGPPPGPPPPPPPPPIFFHSKNWSGLARSSDGSAQGVFSGAAAAADSSSPAAGAAFSVASSNVVGGPDSCSGNSGQTGSSDFGQSNGGSGGFSGQSSGRSGSFSGQSSGGSGGFAGKSSQYNEHSVKNAESLASHGGFEGGQQQSASFKESHFSLTSNGNQQFGSQGSPRGIGGGSGYNGAQSSASSSNGFSGGQEVESFGDKQKQFGQGGAGQQQLSSQFSDHKLGHHDGFHGQRGPAAELAGGQIQQSNNDFNGKSDGGAEFSGGQTQSSSFGISNGQGFSSHKYHDGFNGHQGQEFGGQSQEPNNFGGPNGQSSGRSSNGEFSSSSSKHTSKGGFEGSSGQFNANGGASGSGQFAGNGASGQSGQIRESTRFGGSSNQGSSNSASLVTRQGVNSGGSSNDGFDSGDLQSTLGGALNLASQGLQTSEQSGCSTCGKSTYALSNAKAHKGSAVAISVGG